jgi:hypothetical protein
MSGHNFSTELLDAAASGFLNVPDPGADGDIVVDKGLAICSMVTAASEGRTLKDPLAAGQILLLHFKTDVGDLAVTADSAVNQAAETIMTMADANDTVLLVSIEDGADTYAWRIVANDGATLS